MSASWRIRSIRVAIMYLEKLEIQGFKSFAHKTILQFPARRSARENNITAIVGPNGSGKSNIADAVRWVLGEQSIKLLRGKKSPDVIFSGSSKLARLGFAEAALVLNNDDKKAPFDYEKIVVRRRIFRDGASEYHINSSQVRLADVQLLLAQCNLGHRTYSVISQGMVDAVLNAGRAEKKEFFDEATGVRQHQIKKEQAIKKIEETQANLGQVNTLLEEITPRLKILAGQAQRLHKREGLEKNLISLQEIHYSGIWAKIANAAEALAKNKIKAESEEQTLQKKLAEINKKLAQLETEPENKKRDDFALYQKKYQQSLNQKEGLFRELARLESQLEALGKKENETVRENNIDLGLLLEAVENCKNFLLELEKKNNSDWEKIKKEARIIYQEIEKALSSRPRLDGGLPGGGVEKLKEKIDLSKRGLEALNISLADLQKKQLAVRQSESEKTKILFAIQKEYQNLQADLSQATALKNGVEVELAKTMAHQEDLEEEMERELPAELKKLIKNNPRAGNIDHDAWPQIAKIKHELEMIGDTDQATLSEYEETRVRHQFLTDQAGDLNGGLTKTRLALKNLEELIDKEFNAAFNKIKKYFQENFAILFNGGLGTLELKKENELDALNEEIAASLTEAEKEKLANSWQASIDIKATPPGKKVANLNVLSGGERALTSIALICAIIQANPSPFVVLDEVDAALDEANSERFASILEKLAHHTQFIAITHNRATMEKANLLYGVTMGEDGVSKLLSMDLEKAGAHLH